MTFHSATRILAAITVVSGIALLPPIHQAKAGNGGVAKGAMTQTKDNTGTQNGTAGVLQCVGPGCRGARANAVKATTTGTYAPTCRPGDHFCPHGH